MAGRFIAVVGPSGVGKDSIINALCAEVSTLHRVKRVITRDPEAGGEDYEPVDRATFAEREAAGAFALSWEAHGLLYGIPASVGDLLEKGDDCIANLSRSKLVMASSVFPTFLVLSVTANAETLAQRLSQRGRETPQDQSRRLARAGMDLPKGLNVTSIDNSGRLEDAVDRAQAALGYAPAPASG
ncbi:MAG: phosphonate metabolism protein/1,5-bisphosphokinase (PRPP-forming) PhnN [Devosiaceae bacterium]|nr:phosphonate metabolism protein/1,5-bisphosphokinase (PRPP-forming) PhnN [Devosiaceae bacterium MH13]